MAQVRLKIGKHYRIQMAGLMLFADLSSFLLTGIFIYLMNQSLHFFSFGVKDAKYLVVFLLCLVLFMSSRLYPGVGINPADEIKLVAQFISTSFMIGLILFILFQPNWRLNYWALLPSWGASLITVLLMRWSVRITAAKLGLWGEPVMMIGKGTQTNRLTKYFVERKRLGFVPVLAAIDFSGQTTNTNSTIPVLDFDQLRNYPTEYFLDKNIQTALVDLSSIPNAFQPDVSQSLFRLFRQVIFISDTGWLEGASMKIRDYEGLMGMEACKTEMSTLEKGIKRGLDISVSLLAALLLMPLFIIVAVLIKLDSTGPILYNQERVGRYGKKIKVYKFRSMKKDADRALAECLTNDPAAQTEWEQTKKLKKDPRCTRVGTWIRKFSIDELPQLFNILKGDMSLVGPRPLPDYHHNLLSEKTQNMRIAVRPGLTGMWQVSGRSKNGNNELEMWDCYYVDNWSPWLDVYIILRTIWVVIKADGAY